MEQVRIWDFLAGLGLFLLAMQQLEQVLKVLAGESFKSFLSRHTNRMWKSILSGTIATAFLQSSSVVTLMLLALVGSGNLALKNAVGVVLGSNLGTTFTGWIVSVVGFKLKFSVFVIPGLALGALGRVFFKEGYRAHSLSRFLFAAALLFWGLDLMKESVAGVTSAIDVSGLKDYPILIYFVFGFFATALIQSSSAMMMITLTALNSEVIPFHGAAALVIGADLGTTITAGIGAIKGNVNAKRVALAHFLYNLCVDLIALMALYPLLLLVKNLAPDPLTGLVMFHSSFNLLGILIFAPFGSKFAAYLEGRFRAKVKHRTEYLHVIPISEHREFLVGAKREKERFRRIILALLNQSIAGEGEVKVEGVRARDFYKAYSEVKKLEGEISRLLMPFDSEPVAEKYMKPLASIKNEIRNLGIGLKTYKDIYHNLEEFGKSSNRALQEIYSFLKANFIAIQEQAKIGDEESLRKAQQFIYDMDQRAVQFLKQQQLSEHNLVTAFNVIHEMKQLTRILWLK